MAFLALSLKKLAFFFNNLFFGYCLDKRIQIIYNSIMPTIFFKEDFKHPESGMDFHWCNQNNIPEHNHDYYEIIIISKGSIHHKINNQTSIVQQKELIFVRPTDIHSFKTHKSIQSQHINIAFTPIIFEQLQAFMNTKLDTLNDPNTIVCTSLNDDDYNYLIHQANKLVWNPSQDNFGYNMLLKNMLLSCFILLLQNNPYKKDWPHWLTDLTQKMHSPEYLSYSVKELASFTHYSQSMMLIYFKKYVGQTIVDYFNAIKLNYACTLLENTDFTTLQISSMIGFNSLSYFNKLFKKFFCVTPREYRRAHT